MIVEIVDFREESVGLVTLRFSGDEWESISLNSLAPGQGIGSALIKETIKAADRAGCRRLWLITTNDNTAALQFYLKRDSRLVPIYRDAIEVTRRLKPSLPYIGMDGIPLLDEIELEYLLDKTS